MQQRTASYTADMDNWNAEFAGTMPLLSPLRRVARQFGGDEWPSLTLLQRVIAAADVRVATGLPLRLVPAGGALPYEIRVYESGELECRDNNWHDLFNVLVWLVFPRAKAALNARHYAAWSAARGGGRGAVRDTLTLFDESGLVVLSSAPELLQLIRDFRWKTLFWERRAEVTAGMRFLPFGHALCEKALAPYRGMTGHALLLDVDAEVLALPEAEQLRCVDGLLAALITDPQTLQSTRQLAPVPVLGVPGWCAGNGQAEYYDDTRYFRTGRNRQLRSAAGA